jgi:hypothetical protein
MKEVIIAQLCSDTTCNVCAQSRWERAQEFNTFRLRGFFPIASKTIYFTEYFLPHGEKRKIGINVDDDLAKKAEEIFKSGYVFEIERLTNGSIHMDCSHPLADYPISSIVCNNGPEIHDAVRHLINSSHMKLAASDD